MTSGGIFLLLQSLVYRENGAACCRALDGVGGILFLAVFQVHHRFHRVRVHATHAPSHIVGTYAYVKSAGRVIFGRLFFPESISTQTVFGGALIRRGLRDHDPRILAARGGVSGGGSVGGTLGVHQVRRPADR